MKPTYTELAEENHNLKVLLNSVGALLCDGTVGEMVQKGILLDGLCEEGETDKGLALIIIGYLFNQYQTKKKRLGL